MNILLVDDDETLRRLLGRELGRSGHQIAHAASAAEAMARADAELDVVLLDLMLPDQPGIEVLRWLRAERPGVEVVVLTAHGTVDTAIAAMKLGAYDYVQKPYHLEDLEHTLERACERRRLRQENARLRDALGPRTLGPDFVGRGPRFEELQRLVGKIAASDSTVLVRGETGTGKELIAASIHRLSPRRDQPFVVVDCGSLHENLLQSELFGHEKGSFTGASAARHGLFEAADGGTVFLDEVGDVSPAVQAGLLRVLETSSFRRLGGTREVRVNVRLIGATNRDLERLMAAGSFRRDLYFRLNTIHLEIPPLRQRRDEIACLVEHFIGGHNARHGTRKRASPEALEALRRYDWPGNVRELRHVVERALVLADGDVIGLADLPDLGGRLDRDAQTADGEPLSLDEVERRHIARVLAEVGGHRAQAARLLGISERNLYRKISEYQREGPELGERSTPAPDPTGRPGGRTDGDP